MFLECDKRDTQYTTTYYLMKPKKKKLVFKIYNHASKLRLMHSKLFLIIFMCYQFNFMLKLFLCTFVLRYMSNKKTNN